MDRETFMNGIALGQIAPGPIIITATLLPAGAKNTMDR
jgi:hypothetical protein